MKREELKEGVVLYEGDCLEVLKTIPPESVHCCVTSPPYFGLRDYGTASWDGGDSECDHKPSSTPTTRGLASSTLGGGKSSSGHQQEGFRGSCPRCGAVRIDRQIGLEETPDEYVAKLVEVFRNVRRTLRNDGTLWLNLGDSYAANRSYQVQSTKGGPKHGPGQAVGGAGSTVPKGLKPKDLIGIPWRVAFALQADGWYLRQDLIWHKPNQMPESVRDRCTKSHEYIFLLSKSERYYFDAESVREDSVTKSEKRNRRSVWTVATKPFKGAHFATFPPDLIEPCILAGSPVGGCVLDPFNGAGTTGKVAILNNRQYIGIELNPDYVELTKRRLMDQYVKPPTAIVQADTPTLFDGITA